MDDPPGENVRKIGIRPPEMIGQVFNIPGNPGWIGAVMPGDGRVKPPRRGSKPLRIQDREIDCIGQIEKCRAVCRKTKMV